jgi:hypothetical protein
MAAYGRIEEVAAQPNKVQKTILAVCQLMRAMICAVLFMGLTCCNTAQAMQEGFSLYLNNRSYDALITRLRNYSSEHGYYLTSQSFSGSTPSSLSRHIMLEGSDIRFLLESALVEQCEEREGRREVAYSDRVFDVTVMSTSYFPSGPSLSNRTSRFKDMLVHSGFRVMPRSESCSLL